MVVLTKATLANFLKDNPRANDAIYKWYKAVKNADWSNFNELRRDFNSADAVGKDRYVFNIKGNRFRIITLILFDIRTVFILFIGTHQMYDQIDASTVEFKK